MATLKAYGTALLFVSASIVVARLLDPFIAPHTSPPYFVAVMFASIFGGLGPGLLATLLSSFALAWFDLGSTGNLDLGGDELVRLAVFTTSAVVISTVNAARKRAENELRGAIEKLGAIDRAKNEFIATVSHELRTPLASIMGWTAVLRDDSTDAATQQLALSTIESSARTQAMLVDDLVEASRIVLGKVELTAEPVSVARVVDDAIDVVRPAADAKGIRIERKFSGRAVVSADRHRLKQVIWNLLSNAVKFGNGGGRILVHLTSDGPFAVIEVHDDGNGIPPDLLPYIFDRFRQGPEGAKKGGLGLGLSIAKHIVELHGGRITASNCGALGGAFFCVRIPLIVSTLPSEHDTPDREQPHSTPALPN